MTTTGSGEANGRWIARATLALGGDDARSSTGDGDAGLSVLEPAAGGIPLSA